MKKSKLKNPYITFLIAMICFVLFCISLSKDSTLAAFITLISMVLFFIFIIISVVRAIKQIKERKKGTKSNQSTFNTNNTSSIKSNPNVYTPITNSQTTNEPELTPSFDILNHWLDVGSNHRAFQNLEGEYKLKYHYENVIIVGTKYHTIPEELKNGTELYIEIESDNNFDSNAILVSAFIDNIKYPLGYFKKDTNFYNMANDYLKRNDIVLAEISDVNKMTMNIAFFKKEKQIDICNEKPIAKFTVTGKTDYICLLSIGDEVSIDYDFEKERYLVDSDEDLGYVPESKEEYIDRGCHFYVTNISETDNLKTKVEISIFE